MAEYQVLYGTESGNSEVVADDIVAAMAERGLEVKIFTMDQYSVSDIKPGNRYIIITSTYGDGEFPESSKPFYDEVVNTNPDLSGVEFFAFGLGDSTYKNYNNAIGLITAMLQGCGAKLIGDIGMHDANGGVSLTSKAENWVAQTFYHMA